MLLRNSIAKTKRFFYKNFESFKSFLSGGYERLPKTSPFNPCSCTGTTRGDPNSFQSFRELDNFYRDFSNRWDSSDPDKAKQRKKKNSPPKMSKKQEEITTESFLKFGRKQSPEKVRHEEQRRTETGQEMKKARCHGGGEVASHTHNERNVREKGGQLVVVQKLKELEMMDASDMEHVLDIEEVLHYYSRLTCPAYVDIVEKFFMDICSEFFLPQPSSASSSSANKNFSRSHRF